MASGPANEAPYRLIDDVEFGEGVVVLLVHEPLRLPRSATSFESGRSSRFRKARGSAAGVKISSHTFICEGVTIEDHVFVGHGVDVHQDNRLSPRDHGGWRAADGPRLEGAPDGRPPRRLDRVGLDNPLRR